MGDTEDQVLDRKLLDAARGGDEKAFAQLVERYKQNVFATVVAVTNEFQIAPDTPRRRFCEPGSVLSALRTPIRSGPG